MKQGPYPHGLGRVDEGLVVQGDKSALGGDAVGEGGHGGEEGESLAQKGRVDLRVGVAAHREGALLLLLEGEDQLLAGEGGFPALQLGVVPQKLAQGDPAPLGGLGQGLPRPEDQGLPGVLDHQRLPHRQPAGVRGPVIQQQAGHGDPVLLGDPVEGVPGLHHMNVHGVPPQPFRVTKSSLA